MVITREEAQNNADKKADELTERWVQKFNERVVEALVEGRTSMTLPAGKGIAHRVATCLNKAGWRTDEPPATCAYVRISLTDSDDLEDSDDLGD